MYQNPDSFRLGSLLNHEDRHSWRWTVDTPEDLRFARAVVERLGGGNEFSWLDVADLVTREPELAAINAHVTPKPVIEG